MVLPLIYAGVAVAGAVMGGNAAAAAGEQNQIMAEYNAKVARIQATQTISLAEEDVVRMRDDEQRILSDQKAAYAGQGVDLSSGVVTETEAQTQQVMDDEIAVVRNNARTRAWGLESQARADVTAGQFARAQGRSQRIQSYIGGATTAYVGLQSMNAGGGSANVGQPGVSL